MNITLGSGKKVHSAARDLGTPDCLNWGHKGVEKYRTTTQEVTCARCIKKMATQDETPAPATTAVPTSQDLTYGTATAPCRECRQPARYTIDGIHWCERHRGLADTGTTTPPYLPGDPEPTLTDDVPATKNLTMFTFAGTRKVHAPNGTGSDPRCWPYGGNGSRRWTTTDRPVDCRTCLADECNAHGHVIRATPGKQLDTCDRCGSDLEPTPTDDAPTSEPVTHAHKIGDTATIAGIPGTGKISNIRTMHNGFQYAQVTYPGDDSTWAPLDDITVVEPPTWTLTRRSGDTVTDSGTVTHYDPKTAAGKYLTGEGVYLDHERTDDDGHLRWTLVDAWSDHHVGSVTAVKN